MKRVIITLVVLLTIMVVLPYESFSADNTTKKSRIERRKARKQSKENNNPETINRNVVDVSDKVRRNVYRNLAELLRAEFTGVTLRQTDEGVIVVIRGGTNSLYASPEPMYIIDNTEVFSYEDAETSVDLMDIHTVEVNKDGLGYGIQGANGVVIIKTMMHNLPDQDTLNTAPTIQSDTTTTKEG